MTIQTIQMQTIIQYFKRLPPPETDSDNDREYAQSAVLIGILDQKNPTLILTRRSSTLETHAGQVALPGGMHDSTDRNLADTALRETFEEIGVAQSYISMIGKLTPVYSPYNIAVHPYVAIIDPACTFYACPIEVESIFAVPLDFLLNNPPEQYRGTPCFYFDDYKIWGLTANILVEFIERVREALHSSSH